jgi:hypothetical protein
MTKTIQQSTLPPLNQWQQEIEASLVKQEFYLPDEQFKKAALKLVKTNREILLRKMRLDRDFYKNILNESHREKNPGSYRYVDAKLRIEILNRNGKLLKSLIDE